MDQHLICYFIGITVILTSHLYMLYNPGQPFMTMEQHCYANIAACACIAYYFLNKEKYIDF